MDNREKLRRLREAKRRIEKTINDLAARKGRHDKGAIEVLERMLRNVDADLDALHAGVK